MLLLLVIVCIDAKPSIIKGFNTDYLDKKNTAAINGIFVILIVFSHFCSYYKFNGVYDEPYMLLRGHLGQMVVATFWFYSGYGMMEAIRRKGRSYLSRIPEKFWKLLFRFDVAVLLFLLLRTALGSSFPAKQIVLSLLAYTNIGNSNWYIFIILIEYIVMYAAFSLTSKAGEIRTKAGALLFLVLTIGLVFALIKLDFDDYFYNTVVIMPVGVLYSEFRKEIERIVMHSDISFAVTAMIITGVYIVSFMHVDDYGIESYTVWALSFIAAVILLTMKIRIYNPILEWFGVHIFSVYILQRLTMIPLKEFGCIDNHPYMSLIIAFAATIPLALIFEKATDKMISLIESAAGKKQVS